jgi:hypothetical protein
MFLTLLNTFKRFSLAVLCAIFTCLYLFKTSILRLQFVDQYIIYIASGILWFTISALWIENNRSQQKIIFTAASFFVYAAFSWYVNYLYPRFDFVMFGIFFAFSSLLLIAPSYKDDDIFWHFQFSLIKQFIYVGFLSLILLLGIFLILAALSYLLDFTFYTNQYVDVANIIGTLVFPLSFMAGIPQKIDHFPSCTDEKWLLKLLAYVCVPLISIYALILHIYAIKIFALRTLPQGRVGYLVIAFGMITILVHLIARRFKKDHDFIRLFCRCAGWFLLIPLSLLAWGLYVRITEFGLTEFRYFSSLLGVFIMISGICMILRIRSVYILSAFSLLLLVSVIGNYQKFIARDHLHRLQIAYHQNNDKAIDDALFYLGQIRRLDAVFTLPEFTEKKPKDINFAFKDVRSAIMKK